MSKNPYSATLINLSRVRSIVISLSVCLSVCLYISTPHVNISPNFLYNFPYTLFVGVARSSSDGITIMLCTSGFVDDIMFSNNGAIGGQNQRRRVCLVEFARWRHRGRNLPSPTARTCCTAGCTQSNKWSRVLMLCSHCVWRQHNARTWELIVYMFRCMYTYFLVLNSCRH